MKKIILGLSLLVMAANSFAQTNASKSAPNNLTPANTPLFIVLGSDDNTRADAVKWMQSVIDGGTNKDGSKRYMSFYVNTDQTGAIWNRNTELVDAVYAAYKAGHEIGNHTATHIACVEFDENETIAAKDVVKHEIERVANILEESGIPKEHQFGFRTPYLRYSSFTFDVLKEMGFLYDCSINATDNTNSEIGMYNFPYTMSEDDGTGNFARDNWEEFNYWGEREGQKIARNDNLWELPCVRFAIAPEDYADIEPKMKKNAKKAAMEELGEDFDEAVFEEEWEFDGYVTGLDYNMWNEAEMNEDQTVRSWMQTVTNSLNSNRSPVTIGIHSQYYFETKAATYPNMETTAKKQNALKRFVEEASKLDNVFFVSGDMVIRWMQDPCSASEFKANIDKYRRSPYSGPAAAPTKVRLSGNSITEGNELNVGTLRAVDLNAANTHTFSVKAGDSGDKFEIAGNTLKFKSAQPVGEYIVNVTASNSFGESPASKFYIYVDKYFETDSNLIVTGNDWEESYDSHGTGSKIENLTQPTDENALEATIIVGVNKVDPKTGKTLWPYSEIAFGMENAMTGLSKVIITYTSDKDVTFGISHWEGKAPDWTTDLGFSYLATLPKSDAETTVELTLDDFSVGYAEGIPEYAGSIPGSIKDALDFAGNSIIFAGIEEGSTTNIKVSSLRLIGIPNEKTQQKVVISKSAVNMKSAISFSGISASKLNLNIAKSGIYSVDIFSINGKRLFSAKTAMTTGVNHIQMPKNLAKGIAIIRVSGLNAKLEQKMLIK